MDHIGPEPINWPLSLCAALFGLALLYYFGRRGRQ